MEIELQPNYVRLTVLFLVAFFVFLSGWFGFRAGRDLAKGNLTLSQTNALLVGLKYFYSDQDRYPTPTEFNSQDSMGLYATRLPVTIPVSTPCPLVLTYNTFNQRSFKLDYCMPRGFGGVTKGLHTLTERDIPL